MRARLHCADQPSRLTETDPSASVAAPSIVEPRRLERFDRLRYRLLHRGPGMGTQERTPAGLDELPSERDSASGDCSLAAQGVDEHDEVMPGCEHLGVNRS